MLRFEQLTDTAATWSRCARLARRNQAASLECAYLNPRHSAARKAWLESAALDASRKRSYMRNRAHVESAARIEALGAVA